MSERSPWSWRALFMRRVLCKRCPQCGEGPLFRRFARLHTECPECGLIYRRESGSMTGSLYLSAAVTEVFAVAVVLVLQFGTDWSLAQRIGVGVPLVMGFCFFFLSYAMALWVAVEYQADLGNGETWAQPRDV